MYKSIYVMVLPLVLVPTSTAAQSPDCRQVGSFRHCPPPPPQPLSKEQWASGSTSRAVGLAQSGATLRRFSTLPWKAEILTAGAAWAIERSGT